MRTEIGPGKTTPSWQLTVLPSPSIGVSSQTTALTENSASKETNRLEFKLTTAKNPYHLFFKIRRNKKESSVDAGILGQSSGTLIHIYNKDFS